MLHFYATKYGEIQLENGRTIEVRAGNCLAVLIYKTKEKDGEYWNLWTFYYDTKHLNNILKNEGDILFGENIKRIQMNIFYNEALTLSKWFAKSGHVVEIYYNKQND